MEPLTRRDTLAWTAFTAALIASHLAVRALCDLRVWSDCPRWWPLSVFEWRWPSASEAAAAAGAALVFVVMVRRPQRRLAVVAVTGIALLLLTNLAQGFEDGLVRPIEGVPGGPAQYAADAARIARPLEFLRVFNDVQHDLMLHARTHPPGAVLAIWTLLRLPGGAAAASVTIALVSAALLAFFVALLGTADGHDRGKANGLAFLVLLVPAVQIYGLATLDAVAGALLFGVFWAAATIRRTPAAVAVAGLLLAAAASMTFAALFVLPVVAGWELWRHRTVVRSAALAAVAGIPFLAADRLLGFDYLLAFRTAAEIENPRGFRLFAAPGDYVLTRLEAIAEVALFAGPVLGVLAVRGTLRRRQERPPTFPAAWLAAGTFAVMVLAGVYRTGETARTAIFLYPYLVLAAGARLTDERAWRTAAIALFAQTLSMQLFGDYFW